MDDCSDEVPRAGAFATPASGAGAGANSDGAAASEPSPDPHSESGSGPDPAVAAATEAESLPDRSPGPGPGAVAPGRPWPRRRGPAVLLIVAAAVLGVIGGSGMGYGVQESRTPTPLPPLVGATPEPPAVQAGPERPLPPSQDRQEFYDQDPLSLLAPVPKGATHVKRVRLTAAGYAKYFDHPADTEKWLKDDVSYRSGAQATWEDGHGQYLTERVLRFGDGDRLETPSLLVGEEDTPTGPVEKVPGTLDGEVQGGATADREPGYDPQWTGRGVARVGPLLVEVFVVRFDHAVPSGPVMALVQGQLARL